MTAAVEKKLHHTRRLHGMLVPEPQRKHDTGYTIQLVTADGKEYRIVPDAKGKCLRRLVWLNVEVEGQVFEFTSGTRLLKVEHYHGDDAILELEEGEMGADNWEEVRPEDIRAETNDIYV